MGISVVSIKFRVRKNDTTVYLDSAFGWHTEAIGVTTNDLVCEARAKGTSFDRMPSSLTVKLRSRSPNDPQSRAPQGGLKEMLWEVTKDRVEGDLTVYQNRIEWNQLPFRLHDNIPEIALIVRSGDDVTTDAEVRRVLAPPLWAGRGFSTQPRPRTDDHPSKLDSDPTTEVPPADLVALSGGL